MGPFCRDGDFRSGIPDLASDRRLDHFETREGGSLWGNLIDTLNLLSSSVEKHDLRYGLRYVNVLACTDQQGLRWPPASCKSLYFLIVVVLSRR